MYSIAVIGDRNIVMIFGAAGVDVYAVETDDEARKAFEETFRGEYGVVFIQERFALAIKDLLEVRRNKALPNYCFIPELTQQLDLAKKSIQASIEKALGRKL